ncbi:NADP-dependent oxidoreductase [Chryseobacterium lathyri]|jgi:NADPH:quinone reductase-like Zn-dependent oxidoreductase|uniref:NADPH:quinone reductase n=1 Tax=Chryseobacterium lathyri TaxID=395933 RepID=A0A511YBZ5_9FLAO|nr:NADP-dependent oxidoreductase [Chryseobacterium lathyri]GEN72718.1 NADPH:quinone reductase [Chryseobacterium lathyri]
MKTIILNEAGGVDKLQLADTEKPQIKSNEVLVKVKAIGINPVDVNARAYDGVLNWIYGDIRPVVLGWDIAGEVSEIGDNITDFKIGDRVFGMVNFFGNGKAYAEYVAAPESHLALIPDNHTFEEAAAATLAAVTAYQALVDVAKIKKNDRVLIHAASGGVGHFAVQIAKYFGAYVIGTSSANNKEFVLSMGADEHIDYTQKDSLNMVRDIDIAIDTIQGETLLKSIDAVRPGGIIVTLPSPEIPQNTQDKTEKQGINLEFMMVASKKETIQSIAGLLENKSLIPHIHRTFSFEEMAKAHLEMETKRVVGKIVVTL